MTKNPLLARIQLTPSRRGKKLLAEFHRLGFATLRAIRKALGVDMSTVRRLLYSDGEIHLATYRKLVGLGVAEEALAA